MKPFFQNEWSTLYCGRAEDILPALEEKAQLVVTSPPYNIGKRFDGFADELPWPEYYTGLRHVLELLRANLEVGGTLALNVPPVVKWQRGHSQARGWKDFDPLYRWNNGKAKVLGRGRIEPIGFEVFQMLWEIFQKVREPIVWVRGNDGEAIVNAPSVGMVGCDSDPNLLGCYEFILLASNRRWFHSGGTGRRGRSVLPHWEDLKDVWFMRQEGDPNHPAVFPFQLPYRLIRLFTHRESDVVLDPYAGSGRTLLVATALRRKSIGIELSPRFCRLIASQLSQGRLFET